MMDDPKIHRIYSLYPGRFNPPHEAHFAVIDKLLAEGKYVCIAIRDTIISPNNPLTLTHRYHIFSEKYDKSMSLAQLKIMYIPDIEDIVYGRNVGWKFRRVRLDDTYEKISASSIRQTKRKIFWLTGNVGTGKTTLAYMIKANYPNTIVLDGDELRYAVSENTGFSSQDRHYHNLRIARLAELLNSQGYQVIVSVIAPYQKTRDAIDKIIPVTWVYLEDSSEPINPDHPYQAPCSPALALDKAFLSVQSSLDQIVKLMGEQYV